MIKHNLSTMTKLGSIIIIIINVLSCGIGPVLCTYPKVQLPLGKIEGYYSKTDGGMKFAAFEGIPYAKAPVGKKRFQEPEEIGPWEGTIKANTLSHKCLQYNHYTIPGADWVIGNEDCLYLNVYTNNLEKSTPLQDVVIFIHGGAFMFNQGGSYGPYSILDRNVIFITFNYRLGPLGFLSTEDEVVPGNNGLKDQVMALTWIKQNIEHFGGNSNSITITGMSAGGASTQLHSLSPLSKGLFARGISQSGAAINPWVMVEKSLDKSKQLASHVGCPTHSTLKMIECLKTRSAHHIVEAVKIFQPWLYNPFSPFGVVVDKWSAKPMLPKHPYVLLLEGKVQELPWIFSHTQSEGLYPGSQFAKPEYLEDIDKRWDELIPHILDFNFTLTEAEKVSAAKEIRNYYFKEKAVSKNTYRTLIDVISDRLFVTDCVVAAQLHAAAIKSPVYYYYFSYRGAHSKSEFLAGTNEDFGASHGDDTVYVLSGNVNTKTTASDLKMCKIITDMWISFMHKSIPEIENIKWPEISKNKSDDLQYLVIESPLSLKINKARGLGNREFWETIPFRENKNLLSKPKDEL